MRSLHEKLQVEIQETFAEFLGSVSKDPAKNTGARLSPQIPLSSAVLFSFLPSVCIKGHALAQEGVPFGVQLWSPFGGQGEAPFFQVPF